MRTIDAGAADWAAWLALASAALLAFALILTRLGLRTRPVIAAAATSSSGRVEATR